MDKINEKFRLFQGNGKTDFTINIISDYPSTEESLELLKQKYPTMSNQISSIYESFKPFDRKDFLFFEGTIKQNGVILPFINYVCLNRWSNNLEESVRYGRNFIIIPNRGIELYNLGDYNGHNKESLQTYQQDLKQSNDEHFDRHIFLEKSMNSIARMNFYYKDGSDRYSFRMSNNIPSKQNLYLSSYGYFNAVDIELPREIFGGTTIECESNNYETNEKHGYGMLFDKGELLRLYIQDKKDENVKVTLYALDRISGRYKKYTCNKNGLSDETYFMEDIGSTLSSSGEVTHAVEQRLPNVANFAKTLNPVIENPNYFGIPNEIIAISNESINYAKEKSTVAALS